MEKSRFRPRKVYPVETIGYYLLSSIIMGRRFPGVDRWGVALPRTPPLR